jgi:hypothetical protein
MSKLSEPLNALKIKHFYEVVSVADIGRGSLKTVLKKRTATYPPPQPPKAFKENGDRMSHEIIISREMRLSLSVPSRLSPTNDQ